jgi:hypothetical protein
MRRVLTITCIMLAVAAVATGSEERILKDAVPVADVETLRVDTSVGDVSITGTDGEVLTVEVELTARRGGFFSSLAKSERVVESARIEVLRRDGVVDLRIDAEGDEDDRRFEERWTIRAPARMSVVLDTGVGDVEIDGIAGDIEVDAGVGDIEVRAGGGDVTLDLGVGDARVIASAQAYGLVECSGGIGDSRIDVGDRRSSSDGFMGHSTSWRGDGAGTIEIDAGVGDVVVILK